MIMKTERIDSVTTRILADGRHWGYVSHTDTLLLDEGDRWEVVSQWDTTYGRVVGRAAHYSDAVGIARNAVVAG